MSRPQPHDALFDHIANFQALHAAARRAVRGKRHKPGAAGFMAGLETALLRLERELRGLTWRPGRYVEMRIRDPKPRTVSAAPFRDRVVHHALCQVIEPLFERRFIYDSYACRVGKGTHAALDRAQAFSRRGPLPLVAPTGRRLERADRSRTTLSLWSSHVSLTSRKK
jgi:hypothetical protein